MIRLCANITMMFTEVPMAERFAAAKRAGFPGVEMISPYGMTAEDLGTALRKAGVELANFNAPRGKPDEVGVACLAGREAEFREGLDTAVRYGEATGCESINILGGCLPVGASQAEKTDGLARLASNLHIAAEVFGKAGIACTFEPINDISRPGYLVRTLDEGAAVVAKADHPNLKLEADIYHMGLMKEDIPASFRKYAAIIGHIQFADVPGRGEPGTGGLDFATIVRSIRDIGFDGWVSAEYEPTKRTEDTLGWMRAYSAMAAE